MKNYYLNNKKIKKKNLFKFKYKFKMKIFKYNNRIWKNKYKTLLNK